MNHTIDVELLGHAVGDLAKGGGWRGTATELL